MNIVINMIVALLSLLLLGGKASAYSHDYINDTRSSYMNHVFVSQSVEAEYGPAYSLQSDRKDSSSSQTKQKDMWQGYGFNTTLGLEVLKFVQFDVGHTFVNLRQAHSALYKLSGSRLNGGGRLVFLAPIANLEMGGGLLASRYDYTHELTSTAMYGSGYYYTLGLNYFLNSSVSLFTTGKLIYEHAVAGSDATPVDQFDFQTTNLSGGFSIWL